MDENKNIDNSDNTSELSMNDINELFSDLVEFPDEDHLSMWEMRCAKVDNIMPQY